MATIIPFPNTRKEQPVVLNDCYTGRELKEEAAQRLLNLVPSWRSGQHPRGSVPWAVHTCIAYRQLERDAWHSHCADTKWRSANSPKPKFSTTARGFQNLNASKVRAELLARVDNIGPDERQAASDLKAYDAAYKAWQAALTERARISGTAAMEKQVEALFADFTQAKTLIESLGTNDWALYTLASQ